MKINLVCILIAIAIPIRLSGFTQQNIYIEGNVKTKAKFIENLFRACLSNLSQDDLTEPGNQQETLSQCILNTKIFSDIKVTSTGTNSWAIYVKEKTTFIPIPLIQADSGDAKKFGLFLIESNLFGMGKLLATGGTKSNTGKSYFLTYRDKSLVNTNWTMSVSVANATQKLIQKEGREQTSELSERKLSFGGSLGYRFSIFRPMLRLNKEIKTYDLAEMIDDPNPPDRSVLRGSLVSQIRSSDYKLFFQHGFDADISVSRDLIRGDDLDFQTIYQSRIRYGVPVFQHYAITAELQGRLWVDGNEADSFRKGLSRGFRGSESLSVWAGRYYNASLDYQIPLKTFQYGTWTMAPFLESGMIRFSAGKKSTIRYHSYGIGTYFFLKEIAIPGLGLEFGTNNKFQKRFVSFSAGLNI